MKIKQKIKSHVVSSYHLSSLLDPRVSNSQYTCMSASFFQIGVIGGINPSISGVLGIRMHDWAHPQTNASFRHEPGHHFLPISLLGPSISRIDAAVESYLGGLGCVLRTQAMGIDLGGQVLRSNRQCSLCFDRIVRGHYLSYHFCVSRLFSNWDR